MGLTYQQAVALGIGHLWPTEPAKLPTPSTPPAKRREKSPDGMNKLEREFMRRAEEERLRDSGEVRGVWREPFAVILGGRTRYTPDFLVSLVPDTLAIFETKGFMRDDAAVKLKTAARMLPCFDWYLTMREGRRWYCRRVDRNGISREAWTPDWLS